MTLGISIRNKIEGVGWRYQRIQERRGVRTSGLKPPFYIRRNGNWHLLSAQTFADAQAERDQIEQGTTPISDGTTIKIAVETYLELAKEKAPKTLAQYTLALTEFVESLGVRVRLLEEITVDVLRRYKAYMVEKGFSGKTISTRLNIVYFLLKDNGITARLPKKEMPAIEVEAPKPYGTEELETLFEAMDEEEKIRYKFFLGTGCRDKEVTYAAWEDIDFSEGTYHVRQKKDVGFTPKSHESRVIPMPSSLVSALKARRKNPVNDRWIFVNEEGKPDSHFLRKLKRVALRAGLNCGHCRTTIRKGRYDKIREVAVTCKTDPVCEHWYLHRLRKTSATRWQNAGISVRDIQTLLGHKNLETTQLYLGTAEPQQLRSRIDKAAGD